MTTKREFSLIILPKKEEESIRKGECIQGFVWVKEEERVKRFTEPAMQFCFENIFSHFSFFSNSNIAIWNKLLATKEFSYNCFNFLSQITQIRTGMHNTLVIIILSVIVIDEAIRDRFLFVFALHPPATRFYKRLWGFWHFELHLNLHAEKFTKINSAVKGHNIMAWQVTSSFFFFPLFL